MEETKEMNDICTTKLLSLGATLTEMAVKGTATKVSNKIRAIKEEKNVEKMRNTYDEIINELLNEREEAVRVVQAYKAELKKVVISDENMGNEAVKNEAVEAVKNQVESYE